MTAELCGQGKQTTPPRSLCLRSAAPRPRSIAAFQPPPRATWPVRKRSTMCTSVAPERLFAAKWPAILDDPGANKHATINQWAQILAILPKSRRGRSATWRHWRRRLEGDCRRLLLDCAMHGRSIFAFAGSRKASGLFRDPHSMIAKFMHRPIRVPVRSERGLSMRRYQGTRDRLRPRRPTAGSERQQSSRSSLFRWQEEADGNDHLRQSRRARSAHDRHGGCAFRTKASMIA